MEIKRPFRSDGGGHERSSITKRPSPGWWFLFWWVIITTVTTDLATIRLLFGYRGTFLDAGEVSLGDILTIAVPVFLMIGAGQWLVLRRYIHRSGLWILSSFIGAGIGSAVTWFVIIGFDIAEWLFIPLGLLVFISQTIAGFLQGGILSSQVPRYGWAWWLLVTAIGMFGSLLMGISFYLIVLRNSDLAILIAILFGSPFGLLTGVALMRLLR